jgi:SAM-dependent methyltransferase
MVTEVGVHSVLDVGCGRGISTSWFYFHGVDVQCVEGSHDAIQNTVMPDPSRIVEHDFSRGPWWPEKTYDAVWCVEFLEHVSKPAAVRNDASLVLTPVRYYALLTPSRSRPHIGWSQLPEELLNCASENQHSSSLHIPTGEVTITSRFIMTNIGSKSSPCSGSYTRTALTAKIRARCHDPEDFTDLAPERDQTQRSTCLVNDERVHQSSSCGFAPACTSIGGTRLLFEKRQWSTREQRMWNCPRERLLLLLNWKLYFQNHFGL